MAVLVTLILAAHFAYIAFVVLGGFLAWRWPKLIWVHLAAVGWGILIVLSLVNCPLTWAEFRAREAAGQTAPTQGFVDRFLDGVIYPDRYVNVARAVVALVVVASWVGAWLRYKSRRSSYTRVRRGPDRPLPRAAGSASSSARSRTATDRRAAP